MGAVEGLEGVGFVLGGRLEAVGGIWWFFGSFWGVFGAGLVPLGGFGGEWRGVLGLDQIPWGYFGGICWGEGVDSIFWGVLEADWELYGGLGGGLDPIGGLGGWVIGPPCVYLRADQVPQGTFEGSGGDLGARRADLGILEGCGGAGRGPGLSSPPLF